MYPTAEHARAAETITTHFAADPAVEAVLLVNSCARGKAAPTSCLDIAVLLRPEALAAEGERLEHAWQRHHAATHVYAELLQHGPFSHVDLDLIDGVFDPQNYPHGWTSGADEFELAVGNTLAYSVALYERGGYYQELRARWLPYYSEDLRRQRLAVVVKCCRNNLEHIPLYLPRGLYFQSFKRLYHAFEEFLQALFIAHRVYPIAYDKWVREGVVEILGLPDLYARLPGILEVNHFESYEIGEKAVVLSELLAEYIPPGTVK